MSRFIFEREKKAHLKTPPRQLPFPRNLKPLTHTYPTLEHLIYNILFSRQTSRNPRSDASQVSLETLARRFRNSRLKAAKQINASIISTGTRARGSSIPRAHMWARSPTRPLRIGYVACDYVCVCACPLEREQTSRERGVPWDTNE